MALIYPCLDSTATLSSDANLEDSEKLDEGLLGKTPESKNSLTESVRAQWDAFSLRKALGILARNWRTLAFMVSLMVMAWINVLGNFLFASLPFRFSFPSHQAFFFISLLLF